MRKSDGVYIWGLWPASGTIAIMLCPTRVWLICILTGIMADVTNGGIINCDLQKISEDTNTDYVCCDGVLIYSDEKEHTSCCGKSTYRNDTHVCCNGVVFGDVSEFHCCGKDRFNVKTQVCASNKDMTASGLGRCGEVYYHPDYQFCCNNSTYPIDGHMQCCGVHVHDTRTSTCLDQKIVETSLSCCGGVEMDTSHQICCSGAEGVDFPTDKTESDQDKCCRRDGRPYNSHTHDCAPTGVQPIVIPCGRHFYYPSRDLCCDGNVYVGEQSRGLGCSSTNIHKSLEPNTDEVISHLLCYDKCHIHMPWDVQQLYGCPFHAFIVRRIRRSSHTLGGHRRYLVISDLINSTVNYNAERHIFKFQPNCKPCLLRAKSFIVVTKSFSKQVHQFSVAENTKRNRKDLLKMCS